MITVRQTDRGFERISGNPVIKRLDGEAKAPLRTILHESWTDEDRAAYGIHLAEPFTVPNGKRVAGAERFEDIDGKLVQVFPVEDAADGAAGEIKKRGLERMREEIAALALRVLALEGERQ